MPQAGVLGASFLWDTDDRLQLIHFKLLLLVTAYDFSELIMIRIMLQNLMTEALLALETIANMYTASVEAPGMWM